MLTINPIRVSVYRVENWPEEKLKRTICDIKSETSDNERAQTQQQWTLKVQRH